MAGLIQLMPYGSQDIYLTGNINVDFFHLKTNNTTFIKKYQQLYLLLKEIFPKDVLYEIVQTLFLKYQRLEKNIIFIHTNFPSQLQGIKSADIINFMDGNDTSTIICVDQRHAKTHLIDALNIMYYCLNIRFENVDICANLICANTHVKISKGAKNIWNT